jgi:hypothetical protein
MGDFEIVMIGFDVGDLEGILAAIVLVFYLDLKIEWWDTLKTYWDNLVSGKFLFAVLVGVSWLNKMC